MLTKIYRNKVREQVKQVIFGSWRSEITADVRYLTENGSEYCKNFFDEISKIFSGVQLFVDTKKPKQNENKE